MQWNAVSSCQYSIELSFRKDGIFGGRFAGLGETGTPLRIILPGGAIIETVAAGKSSRAAGTAFDSIGAALETEEIQQLLAANGSVSFNYEGQLGDSTETIPGQIWSALNAGFGASCL